MVVKKKVKKKSRKFDPFGLSLLSQKPFFKRHNKIRWSGVSYNFICCFEYFKFLRMHFYTMSRRFLKLLFFVRTCIRIYISFSWLYLSAYFFVSAKFLPWATIVCSYIKIVSLIVGQRGYVNGKHLELIRRLLKRFRVRSTFFVKLVFPYKFLFCRTSQIRMGKGKGSKVVDLVYPIRAGCPLFRLYTVGSSARFSLFFFRLSLRLPLCMRSFFFNNY